MTIEDKLKVIEACRPILEHLKATKGILSRQQEAKAIAAQESDAAETQKRWCDGYAAAMKDAVRALDAILEEYS